MEHADSILGGIALVITAVAGLVGSLSAWSARRHAKSANENARAANQAVNQRPPGEPSLYELAQEARDIGLTNRATLDQVDDRLAQIDDRARGHEQRSAAWSQWATDRHAAAAAALGLDFPPPPASP